MKFWKGGNTQKFVFSLSLSFSQYFDYYYVVMIKRNDDAKDSFKVVIEILKFGKIFH